MRTWSFLFGVATGIFVAQHTRSHGGNSSLNCYKNGKSTPQEMSQHMKDCMDRCMMYRISMMKLYLHRDKSSTWHACKNTARGNCN